MNARKIGMLGAVATLVGSGAYVFVYLYRWEWNRAQVSAAIFIAAEVGLVGWLLADRLRRVERRLELATVDGRAPPARRPSGRRRRRPGVGFAWLARPDRMGVFIPVLLGAGALLSGVAWVVERLARATAGRAAEQRPRPPARRARAAPPAVSSTAAPTRSRCCAARSDEAGRDDAGRRCWRSSAAVFVMRRGDPEPARAVDRTARRRRRLHRSTRAASSGASAAAAIALWAVCSSTVGGTCRRRRAASATAWRATVAPAIGEHGENRLVGCLEDVTIDRVLGDVVAIRSNACSDRPAPPPAPDPRAGPRPGRLAAAGRPPSLFVLLAVGAALESLPWDQPDHRRGDRRPHAPARRPRPSRSPGSARRRSCWPSPPSPPCSPGGGARSLAVAIVVLALARPLVEFALKELVGRRAARTADRLVRRAGPVVPERAPVRHRRQLGLRPARRRPLHAAAGRCGGRRRSAVVDPRRARRRQPRVARRALGLRRRRRPAAGRARRRSAPSGSSPPPTAAAAAPATPPPDLTRRTCRDRAGYRRA